MPMELVNRLPYTHPYRWDGRAFGGPQLWRPSSLGSALGLWLDAEDAASITLNGSTVSQWRDKSGNARHASQATAANQPVYTLSGLNGKPVVTFDGTKQLNTPSFLLGDTVVTVARRSATTQPVVQGANVGSNDRGLWGINAGGNNFTTHINYGINGGPLSAANADGFPLNEPQIVTQTVARGLVATTSSVWEIGGGGGGYMLLNGFISEMVATSALLSTTDRQRLEGYLAWKWGMEANLPAGHPFKNTPPTV